MDFDEIADRLGALAYRAEYHKEGLTLSEQVQEFKNLQLEVVSTYENIHESCIHVDDIHDEYCSKSDLEDMEQERDDALDKVSELEDRVKELEEELEVSPKPNRPIKYGRPQLVHSVQFESDEVPF